MGGLDGNRKNDVWAFN
ncbi:hypothetical protein KO532_02550 [Zobellia galactanivorans]|nr:hypothetical protein [Zobellia galactanivorans]